MLEDKNNELSKGYKITSLYFDTPDDQDLNQNLMELFIEKKYRIRIYDKICQLNLKLKERKSNY